MDDCADCGRRLRDLVCRTCRMIYIQEVHPSMYCINCGKDMIRSRNLVRHKCSFCQFNYFAMAHYDPSHRERFKEYVNALERPCLDCNGIMTINPMNYELVCRDCGLVFEYPIYTQI